MDTLSPRTPTPVSATVGHAGGVAVAMQRAVDRLRSAADKVLRADLPAMCRAVVDELDHDADTAKMARAARILLAEENAFTADFFIAFDRSIATGVSEFAGAAPAARPKLELASLALVEFDQMEETMVVDRMGARLRNAVDDLYTVLNQRLANVVRAPKLGDRDNPFHPMRFAQAFNVAIEGRGLVGETRIALLKGFERALLESLKQIYDEMNLLLAADGVSDIVDPELLRHTMAGARVAQAQRSWPNTLAGQVRFDGAPLLPDVPSTDGHSAQLLQAIYQGLLFGGALAAPAALPAGCQMVFSPNDLPRVPFGQVEPILAPSAGMTAASGQPEADQHLLAAVGEKQRATAHAMMAAADGAAGEAGLAVPDALAQRAELIERATRQLDKLTIELVGLVFERIHGDKYLPGAIKLALARLQFPFLRAALSDPDLFVSSEAPARRLMDRIATSAIGWEPEGADNQRFLAEVDRAVNSVVLAVAEGPSAFERALDDFETFLASERERDDDPVQRAKRALEEVEVREVMAINAMIGVRRAFEGVLLESYLRDFLLGVWVRVLVAATLRARSEPGFEQRFKDVVPGLVWSVQPKLTQEDRRRLVTVIPRALSTLREGLVLVEWPQAKVAEFFGRLMASHANAVRALELAHGVQPPVVDPAVLRQRLAEVAIAVPPDDEYLGEVEVDASVVRREVERSNADLAVLDAASGPIDGAIPAAHFADHEIDAVMAGWGRGDGFLLQVGEADEQVRLRWISPRRSFYLFVSIGTGAAHSLSPEVVRSYIRTGRLRPVESQPLFERVVGRLMQELSGGTKN
ncbi:MAG: DUF1631 family protein [Burkholderiaceae bacterium]